MTIGKTDRGVEEAYMRTAIPSNGYF